MEAAGSYKITRAGQVTIPRAIRKDLELEEGNALDFYYDGDLIVIKKRRAPMEVFESLAEKTRERFKRKGITRADVDKAVKAVRDETGGS